MGVALSEQDPQGQSRVCAQHAPCQFCSSLHPHVHPELVLSPQSQLGRWGAALPSTAPSLSLAPRGRRALGPLFFCGCHRKTPECSHPSFPSLRQCGDPRGGRPATLPVPEARAPFLST